MSGGSFSLTDAEFKEFREFLQRNSGVDLEDNRRFHLCQVIEKRKAALELPGAQEYLDYLIVNPKRVEEQQKLINELTITQTYFFRNKPHFEVLKSFILPQIAAKKTSKKLKIWSAGCSSGEEPYTIAIVVHELRDLFRDWEIEILGTDVNSQSLEQAREAVYLEGALKMTDPRFIKDCFTLVNNRYHLKYFIRQMLDFRFFNLIKEPYPLFEMRDFDLIFCRNVTIYFKKSSTRRVVQNFFKSLRMGGYLFIGHAESLHGINTNFTLQEAGGTFFYRKSSADDSGESLSWTDEDPGRKKAPDMKPTGSNDTIERLQEEGFELLAAGKPEEAIFGFNRMTKIAPYQVEPYLFIGQIYAGRGVYHEALAQYKQALAIVPLSAEIHFLIGLVYWEMEDIASASDYFKKAKYFDPEFCLSYYYLGLVNEKLRQPEMALKEFKAAVIVLEHHPAQIEKPLFAGFQKETIERSCREKIKQMENK